MREQASLLDRLRNFIVGEMHIGHLEAGDRLPTYREIAHDWEVDHRAVARAYRALEAEGLVEIRERQGVFLREQEKIGGEMPTETAEWVADEVLSEAWRRRIKIPELPEFIRRCTASVKLRCACIESTEDHRWMLCRELSEWFGFETRPVHADRLPSHGASEDVRVVDLEKVPAEVHEADLLVSTLFHAASLRAVAEVLRKPYVIVRVHPTAVAAIERHLRERDLTVVCLDPRFGERVQIFAANRFAGRIRVVLADDKDAVAQIGPNERVLASRAAAKRLERDFNFVVNPRTPAFDPSSARELARLLIRLNLEALETKRQNQTT
jgi:DNA-binding transcriptional regulator YhcF (GntR family)